MNFKYNTLTRSKGVLTVCRPTIKALLLVSLAFLCLITLTVFSFGCFSPGNPRNFCPISFQKPARGFESVPAEFNLQFRTNTETLLTSPNTIIKSSMESRPNYLQEDNTTSVLKLREIIDAYNLEQKIWNLDKFGPVTSDTTIIVIQVHNRLQYLRVLIKCLEQAKYIESTLVVFSHGYYSQEINKVVQSIQFARVLQIFFPYILQTHPNTFPGFSPGDCPHGVKKEELVKIKCVGKARDVKSLQVKHHWWWKLNMVFNGLRVTREFSGLVFLLEEDHYVFPDFLHVLRLMRKVAPEKCPDCNIYGLGIPQPTTVSNYKRHADQLQHVQWNNMGFAFDRQFWVGLSSPRCAEMFCGYNDYNWDFTLAYLSWKCLPQDLKPLNVVSSRVFHIGACGLHFHGNCSDQSLIEQAAALQRDVAKFLFPPALSVKSTWFLPYRIDGRNGGWDDPRDIELCRNISRELHR